MKRNHKRTAAAICAAVLCASCMGMLPASAAQITPVTAVQSQAGELMTRNSHIDLTGVHTYESEHFKFYWGDSGTDSGRVSESFLAENAKHLEACWNVYMNDLSMNPPTESVNPALRDGNHYKVNFYLHNTGLRTTDGAEVPADWAYMGYDNQGYAFMFCCVDAMQNSPNPSWVLPHEFGHVVTAHQYGWNENKYVQSWWEAIANWYREQFLYSDYYSQWITDPASGTDYFETYMKNLHFTPILGRDNYASWAFLQYLTENPDGMGNYGSDFVKTLMQEGKRDEYPYAEIERLGGADIKDTLGNYAKRLATLDFKRQQSYQARQNQMLADQPWSWNQIFTVLEESQKGSGYYTVPSERAPQQFGVNIIPLETTGDSISVKLEGLTNVKGADWRACIAVEMQDGSTKYSDLFKAGETMEMAMPQSAGKAYLVVTATPDSDTWQQVGVPWAYGEGEFDENHVPFLSKTRYPYAVTIQGASVQQKYDSGVRGHAHSNGGGFVADSANVDDSVYVAPDAQVLGFATVSGNARILGHAVVANGAKVSGNAIIGDSAVVTGSATVDENARVLESAFVTDTYHVTGNATVKGTAFLYAKGTATGQAMPDGDYYDDSGRTVQAGSMYGWTSPDAYVASRPYQDGQVAGLEFDADSSLNAADTYTSTFGTTIGQPTWEAERTSGKGVLTLTADQALIADGSYAALHDAQYQTAVLIREDGDIFHFGTDTNYLSLTTDNGAFYLNASDGTKFEDFEIKDAYKKGEWVIVEVNIKGDTVSVSINGQTMLTDTMTIDPVQAVQPGASYLLGGGGLSMDYFRVNFKAAPTPEYTYSETEEVSDTPEEPIPSETFIYGDINRDGDVDVFDLSLYKRMLVDGRVGNDRYDLNMDGKDDLLDLIALQKYIHGIEVESRIGESMTVYM